MGCFFNRNQADKEPAAGFRRSLSQNLDRLPPLVTSGDFAKFPSGCFKWNGACLSKHPQIFYSDRSTNEWAARKK
jgi:hypothetical protein